MKTIESFVGFVIAAIGILLASPNAQAALITLCPTTGYVLRIDNGVVYFINQYIASPCLYQRVEIRDTAPYSAVYANRMYAALLAAKISGASISVVYDDSTAPNCVLSTLQFAN